jgi:DNA repair exonuclease SbcCD ATPase subunit
VTRQSSIVAFWAIIAITLLTLFWPKNLTEQSQSEQTEASVPDNGTLEPVDRAPASAPTDPQDASVPPNPSVEPQTAEQADAAAQLAAAREQLAILQENLAQLQQRRSLQVQQIQNQNLTLPSRLAAIDADIQNLSDLLEENRAAEANLGQAVNAEMQRQSAYAEYLRSQIEESLRALTQQMQQAQFEINQMGFAVPPMPEQRARLAELQALHLAQQQQLQELMNQRAAVSPALANSAWGISTLAQAQQDALIADQDFLRDEIYTLRNQAVRMQQEQAQVQMSAMSLNQQIAQLETAIQNQRRVVRELENPAAK